MKAGSDGYAWFTEDYEFLADAYCVTLIKGLSADEFTSRIDGASAMHLHGLSQFLQPWSDLPWPADVFDEPGAFQDRWMDGKCLVALTEVDGWLCAIEINSGVGVGEETAEALSRDTELVSHFTNIEGDDEFVWMVDGVKRLAFYPSAPSVPEPSEAGPHGVGLEGIADLMEQCGFDLSGSDDMNNTFSIEASFALAEKLTGVRLTAGRLEQAHYSTVVVARL
jgi:hypothetical protein